MNKPSRVRAIAIAAGLACAIAASGLTGCSTAPVYMNADPRSPLEQLAIIRVANETERQQPNQLFKPNYTEHLASVTDTQGNWKTSVWNGFTDKEARVAPGEYVVSVTCELGAPNMVISSTVEQSIDAKAGMIYALECANVRGPRTYLVVEARRQGTAPKGQHKAAKKRP